MEDQGEASHQTFLVKKFTFLLRTAAKTKWPVCFQVSFDYRSQIQSSFLYFRKEKMTMYNIIWKINSTFGTIGKAMTDKLTETVDGKNSSFHIN